MAPRWWPSILECSVVLHSPDIQAAYGVLIKDHPPANRNFVVSASLLRGRYRGVARLIHIRHAMTQAYRHLSHTAPIFASLALVIFEELTAACLQWSGDLPLGQDVWHRCSAGAPLPRKGYQLSLSRCRCIGLYLAS